MYFNLDKIETPRKYGTTYKRKYYVTNGHILLDSSFVDFTTMDGRISSAIAVKHDFSFIDDFGCNKFESSPKNGPNLEKTLSGVPGDRLTPTVFTYKVGNENLYGRIYVRADKPFNGEIITINDYYHDVLEKNGLSLYLVKDFIETDARVDRKPLIIMGDNERAGSLMEICFFSNERKGIGQILLKGGDEVKKYNLWSENGTK